MKGTTLKKVASAILAGAMLLSCASCALFGAGKKEVIESASAFADALVKMNAKKIIKLTDEKKTSKAAEEITYILSTNMFSANRLSYLEAVQDTITYEIKEDTVTVENDKASVDVVFTMVDYEKALKDGDFESIDDVLVALEDCEDTTDITVGFEFKKDGDKWLISNLKDKDYKKLYEFMTYSYSVTPELASTVDDTYIYGGSYYIDMDVYFTEDISSYSNMITYDVYYEGDLIASDRYPSVYSSDLWIEYYNDDYSDLASGDYTIVVKVGDTEFASESVTINNSYDEVSYDYDTDIEGAEIVYYGSGNEVINLWSFTNEVPNMIETYMDLNPDFASDYTVKCTIIPTSDNLYQPALDEALYYGGADAPDIYTAEAAFVMKYTQGDMSYYAADYADLISDVDVKIAEADIAQYTVDVGTNEYGELVGLGYQATGGAFIYRRSVAIDVFGTDDPDEIEQIIGAGSGSWDQFWNAAQTCADNGVAIVSGDGDIWHAVENSNAKWIVNGSLNTDTGRFDFFDMAYDLYNNGWSNGTSDWTDGWYDDMCGTGPKPILGFFGPAWLINYVMAPNCGGEYIGEGTYGDWAVCAPPVGFFWGGTWVLANKNTEHEEGVAELLEWITLDVSDTGLQYLWANGLINGTGIKDCVASSTVMSMSDGTLDFLNGQDMFPTFIAANYYATGDNMTQWDDLINSYFRDAVRQYALPEGEYYGDKDAAIESFEDDLYYYLGI